MRLAFAIAVLAGLAAPDRGIASEGAAAEGGPVTATIEVAGPLERAERRLLADAGIEVAEYLGENSYLALLPAGAAPETLLDRLPFLRAVQPMTAAAKIAPDLRAGKPPAHARLPDGRIKARVELFASGEARTILERHADAVRRDQVSGAWEVEIEEDRLEELAAEPAVKRIEAAPDPRLL